VKRVKVLTVLSLFVLGLFVVMALGSGADDEPAPEPEEPEEVEVDEPDEDLEAEEAVAEPEPEPAEEEPVPDPIVYTGSGDDVIQVEKPEEGPVMLYIEGNEAERHFAVTGFDENDNQTELFVNTTSYYEGITLDPDGTTVLLEINAEGPWTVESRSVRSARSIEVPGSIEGRGDEVLLVEGESSLANITGNPDARHFAVIGYTPFPNLMVNTTDAYEGTVRVDSDTFLLEITAVGNWEIELE